MKRRLWAAVGAALLLGIGVATQVNATAVAEGSGNCSGRAGLFGQSLIGAGSATGRASIPDGVIAVFVRRSTDRNYALAAFRSLRLQVISGPDCLNGYLLRTAPDHYAEAARSLLRVDFIEFIQLGD